MEKRYGENRIQRPVIMNPRDIPKALLTRYQTAAPRYTSYPTAPQFSSDVDKQLLLEKWRQTNTSGRGISIYSHIPFCNTRCLYCGCFTHINRSSESKADYVEAMKRELDYLFTLIDSERPVHQLAFGGGTPTHLPAEQLADFVAHLCGALHFHPEAERSIEIDPRSIDEAYLAKLLEMEFNRFSFGVQDLNPQVQRNVNRILTVKKLQSLMDSLRREGVQAVNFDLIYGLPGQTPDTFRDTILRVVEWLPSRIALFGYAHVPWVSPHQKSLERLPIPGPEARMELFGTAYDLLLDAGYSHIGMDHFALNHDELLVAQRNRTLTRNFMGYTTRRGLDLMGIGSSSISSVGSTYTQNRKDITEYSQKNNRLHWEKGILLSREDELRREIIMELFCNFFLDIPAIEDTYSIDFCEHFRVEIKNLRALEKDGLLEVDENALKVSDTGRFFIRNICMQFDRYLANGKSSGRYSRTI